MGALAKFSEQTSLHGFGFIVHSPHWIPAVLYGILTFICAAMMIRDTISLFNQYNNEPTKVDVIVMANKTFDLGRPTVCFVPDTFEVTPGMYPDFPLWVSTWDSRFFYISRSRQLLFRYNVPSVLTHLDNFFSSYSYNVSEIIGEISNLANNTQFTQWYTPDKATMFSLIYQTAATIAAVEAKLLSTQSSWKTYLAKGETESVRQYLITKKIDFMKLIELLGLIICRKVRFGFMNSKDFCGNASLSWWGFTDFVETYDHSPKICYKFPSGALNFQSLEDFQTLAIDGTHNVAVHWDYYCHILLDFSGRRAFYSKHSQMSTIELCIWKTQDVKVNIDSEDSFTSLARDRCQDNDKLDCEGNCELDFYMSNCNCFPITIMTDVPKPDEMPYCASLPLINLSEELMNVSAIETRRLASCKSKDDVILQCKESCSHECRRRQFRFTLGNLVYKDAMAPSLTIKTRVFIADFVYLFFNESLLLTWFDVLMSLGGSIGFWLGGSIIAFIHVGIFFLTSGFTWMLNLRKNQKTKPMPLTVSS